MSGCLIKDAINQLTGSGLRVTKQRKAMIEVLASSDIPLSAEETFRYLSKGACDLVTVYRSLEQLEKAGVIQLGVRENGTKVYCLAHGNDHHHHLTCRSCGRTERVDVCMGEELEMIGRSFGFSQLSHVMELFGLCPECSKER